MSCNYWFDLSRDYEAILEIDDEYDVIIEAGECPNATKFLAHSFVLRVRCVYFKRAFQNNWSEKTDDGYYIFKKPNISATVFRVILRYLYTGTICYKDYDLNTLLQCLVAADELCLLKFIEHVEEYLCSHPNTFSTNVISTLEVIYKIESVKRLTDYCLKIISGKPEILLSSEWFLELDPTIIKMVMQRKDLQLSYSAMWDLLIRWVSARHLMGQDSGWSLREAQNRAQADIKDLIPLIEFRDIPKVDFFTKVLPHRDLLPPELITSVLEHHRDPLSKVPLGRQQIVGRRHSNFSSVLIDGSVFDQFTKWINQISDNGHDSSYTFQLLFRGSRDGFSASSFHQCCDLEGPTMVVTMLKSSNKVVGGYNPLLWTSSNQWLTTTESFIFTLNPDDVLSADFGRVKRSYSNNAIQDLYDSGPIFGSGPDLLLNTSDLTKDLGVANCSVPEYDAPGPTLGRDTAEMRESAFSNMSNFIMPSPFDVMECEVFLIIPTG